EGATGACIIFLHTKNKQSAISQPLIYRRKIKIIILCKKDQLYIDAKEIVSMVYQCIFSLAVFYCVVLAASAFSKDEVLLPKPDATEKSLYRLFESMEKWVSAKMDAKYEHIKQETAQILKKMKDAILLQTSQVINVTKVESAQALNQQIGVVLLKLAEDKQENAIRLNKLQEIVVADKEETAEALGKFQEMMNAQAGQHLSTLLSLQQTMNADKEETLQKLKSIQASVKKQVSQQLASFQKAIKLENGETAQMLKKLQDTTTANKKETVEMANRFQESINQQKKTHIATLQAINEQKRQFLTTLGSMANE
uniref:Uncharacterized protein n=1 Tax=Strigamia maritima TaxID=126957 RepID=T1J9A8_STRMM